ncbi:MAG TPA: hypothetical protein VEQ12_13405 [Candidatus Limnocylindria bacterium]|nr:hypothetical protein [Candidatus Limnocylindria bacterium]
MLAPGANSPLGGAVSQYLISNPAVCGAAIFVSWQQVDRGPGTNPRYDWSAVQSAIAPWEAAGKTVNLIVWGASEGGTVQRSTPAWVQAQVQMINCGGKTAPTPVYWQPGYANNWRAFIVATVKQFASDPHIGYLRFGLGTGGEGLASAGTKTPSCLAQWNAAGYQTEWPAYVSRLVAFEGSLHANHQLMVAINTFDAMPSPEKVAQEASQDGIGFGMEGLQASDAAAISAGQPCCDSNWCAVFTQFAGTVPLHLQTLYQSDPSGAPATGSEPRGNVRVGPLPPLLQAGLTVHAQIFELYAQDWLIAFEPQHPGYAQYHAAYAQAIDSAAAVVGTANGVSAP